MCRAGHAEQVSFHRNSVLDVCVIALMGGSFYRRYCILALDVEDEKCKESKELGCMCETNLEIMERNMNDFKDIQRYMLLAKKENATETYAELKDKYMVLKTILNVAGVNLTDIDKIKE